MTTPLKRARQACLACNARRVKCNVTERMPCRRCAATNERCEVRASRRGKHPRHPRVSTSDDRPANHLTDEHAAAASQVLADKSSAQQETIRGLSRDVDRSEVTVQLPQCSSANPFQPDSRQEDEATVFLGESTSIRYMHNDLVPPHAASKASAPNSLRFLHSVPNTARAESLMSEWETERRRTKIKLLTAEGVFSFPSEPVVEELLDGYFRWFHPCFPIVDEAEMRDQRRQGSLSPLLLQAILFVSVIHCSDDHLHRLGLGNQQRAKSAFYNNAKDIYDADFEPRKLIVIQALFLMSFWRSGALLEKETRHWLGVAISLAETKALHRSAGRLQQARAEKVRKRTWWSIYIRERQCAAALGLPNRFRDEDCDIKPLEEGDFDYAFDSSTTSAEKRRKYVAYAIGMAHLSRRLGQVVHGGYLPNMSLSALDRSKMRDDLVIWRRGLPSAMQIGRDEFSEQQPGFHANMLHLAYNNILILLYRSEYIGTVEESGAVDEQVALRAAVQNSRIIEDMLSEGNLRHAQIHVITNLFNTLCIHTVRLRTSLGTSQAIAEQRAKVCLLGLQELQKTWEVQNWVLQLFFQCLDRPTAARLQTQDESATASGICLDCVHQGTATMPFSSGTLPQMSGQQNSEYSTDQEITSGTVLSWSTEEANQYLFHQIENDFAFGEGGTLDWNSDDAFHSVMLSELGSEHGPVVQTQHIEI